MTRRVAREERLNFARGAASPFLAPHFVEMVLAGAGEARPERIETTLDAALQGDVAGIIETHREALQRHGAANVAVVVLHNATGEWLAWEGSGDYFNSSSGGAINGAVMPRQPGSALKPFTYALAFEEGFSPASVLPDVPSSFPTAEEGIVYTPRNYDGRFRGPLLARVALAGSENVPAVALASQVGHPEAAAVSLAGGLVVVRPDRQLLRPRIDARQRGGPARRAGGRVCRVRARRRVDPRQAFFLTTTPARVETRARLEPDRVLDHRHPLGCRRARVRLRPRRQPRTSVPGRRQDRHVAGVPRQLDDRLFRVTSPSASGWGTSIASRCATRAA